MYLYKSWDESMYLTEQFDGNEGLVTELHKSMNMQEILYYAEGDTDTARDLARAVLGEEPQVLEVLI